MISLATGSFFENLQQVLSVLHQLKLLLGCLVRNRRLALQLLLDIGDLVRLVSQRLIKVL